MLEMLFGRPQAKTVLKKLMSLPQTAVICTSVISIATLFYFVEREKINKQTVHNFIENYRLLDINSDDYHWAKNNDMGDFEDALQIACAKRHGCVSLLTLDKNLYRSYGRHFTVSLITNSK